MRFTGNRKLGTDCHWAWPGPADEEEGIEIRRDDATLAARSRNGQESFMDRGNQVRLRSELLQDSPSHSRTDTILSLQQPEDPIVLAPPEKSRLFALELLSEVLTNPLYELLEVRESRRYGDPGAPEDDELSGGVRLQKLDGEVGTVGY